MITVGIFPSLKFVGLQIHHGDADFHIKKESIDGIHQEMRERDADWSFCTYGKAAHGFTEPGRTAPVSLVE